MFPDSCTPLTKHNLTRVTKYKRNFNKHEPKIVFQVKVFLKCVDDGGDDGGGGGDGGSDGLSHIATDERMFVKETVVDDPGFGLPLSLSAVQPQDDAGVGGHNNQPETNNI